ncbi:hypothetical protein EF913_23130 [Streptomyces sp. WAC04189]|uniref:hypothetical protein n=1 Tax=Streptomyces sp. WAC04189 TaxID=2487411 RepID=UPI000FAC6EC4|nr:hypothetical protein [Streptomyces sp. WAC04189]RSR99570.1 hypothetical protein EF913_23130 [Streptomyces sp. WAC04189]
MYDDNGAPTLRRTLRAQDVDDSAYLALELEEEHGAEVSRGRVYWRGLGGHDPYDDLTPEEFGERQWQDYHDRVYDEAPDVTLPQHRQPSADEAAYWESVLRDEDDDLTSPQRRRPSGRAVDVEPPAEAPVTVRVDPAIAAAFAAKQEGAEEGRTWEVQGGTVTTVGDFKVFRGTCESCGEAYELRRPASQRRKWRVTCGDECAKELDRAKSRERWHQRQDPDAA